MGEDTYGINRTTIDRIVAEIAVDAPLPRDEEFRLGKFYADRCRETSLALHGAMEAKPIATRS